MIERPNPLARAGLYLVLTASAVFFLLPLAWTAVTSLKEPGQAFDQRWLPMKDASYIELDGRRQPVQLAGKGASPGAVRVRLLDRGGEREVPAEAVRRQSRLAVHWANYSDAATILPFGWFFLNSIFVALLVTAGQLITCSLAAYAFARLKFPGRDRIFLLYLATMMLPGQVTTIPVYLIMRHLHWVDSYQAVILPSLFSAYGTFLLRQYFLTIPRELAESARVEGASLFQIFWHIYLPLAKPALAALAVFTFMGAWNDLLHPLIYLPADLHKTTITVGLSLFQTQYGGKWTVLMAGTLVSVAPLIVVFFVAQRQFIEGISLTGLRR